MAKRISELDDAGTLTGTEQMEVVQAGGNKKITVSLLARVAQFGTNWWTALTTALAAGWSTIWGTAPGSGWAAPLAAAYINPVELGMKHGLKISYVSSDLIRIGTGAVEVNGVLVTKSAVTDFTTGATNFPGADAKVFVVIDAAGTISLVAATGNGTIRASDACFQVSGGGVGYDDLGKFGYYTDSTHKILGTAHRTNATTWLFANCGRGISESGEATLGSWERTENRKQIVHTNGTSTAPAASSKDFPVAFSKTPDGTPSVTGGYTRYLSFTALSASAFTLTIWNVAEAINATTYTAIFHGWV